MLADFAIHVTIPTLNSESRRWKFESKYTKSGDNIVEDGRSDDLVIAVMGPTGVGKSTFINAFLESENEMVIGHGLVSCTEKLQHRTVTRDHERLVILDTPGFDDTYIDDAEILRRISVWLAKSYLKRMKLAGVLYLVDITQTRMHGSTRENIEMMKELCGRDNLKTVVCVTTKWSEPSDPSEVARECELKDKYLSEMIESGAQLMRFTGTSGSAQGLVESALDMHKKEQRDHICLQKELVDNSKLIPETSAGKQLRRSLGELIEKQRRAGLSYEQISKTIKAIQTLDKISVFDRFKL